MPHKSKKQIQRRRNNSRYIFAGVVIVALFVGVGWYLYSSNQGASSSTTKTTTSKVLVTNSTSAMFARIETSLGNIEVQLFPSSAPETVRNFISLVNSGFYDDLVWHRIMAGFVIQTGDPNTRNGGGNRSLWGVGGSSQTVPLEIDYSLKNYVGYVGMARKLDPNSGTSQFYINLTNNSNLDGQYTVFGKVISGMDVVYTIGNSPVNSAGQPINPIFITKITILNNP